MNKRMREIQSQIMAKSAEAKGYSEGENMDIVKAASLMDEVDALQKEFETLERIEKSAKAGVPTKSEPEKVDAFKALADAARKGFKANMNETAGADGGYTVPEDIRTAINRYKEEKFSLKSLIGYEHVTTNKGRRTYKTREQHTGFTQVGEGAAIGQTGAPKFEVMNYEIKKFAGWMPVTNELLEDSDAAIANLVVEWLGDEEVATENAQILAKVKEKEAVAMSSIDDIKKAVNVDLAAFAGSVRIVTNSDGLQYLDTLKDTNKRYLLAPDPADHMNMYLSVGARRIPVTVVPNAVLPTEGGKLPFIVGDLKEYMQMFDRKQMSIKMSDVAAVTGFNAYEQDMTLWRAIMRADWQVKDAMAIVRGELTVA